MRDFVAGFLVGVIAYHYRIRIMEAVLRLVERLKGKKVVMR